MKQINKPENYWEYSTDELDKVLGTFWFAVTPQKEGSDHYTVSSLHHIRYGIKRLLQIKAVNLTLQQIQNLLKASIYSKKHVKSSKGKDMDTLRGPMTFYHQVDLVTFVTKNSHLLTLITPW